MNNQELTILWKRIKRHGKYQDKPVNLTEFVKIIQSSTDKAVAEKASELADHLILQGGFKNPEEVGKEAKKAEHEAVDRELQYIEREYDLVKHTNENTENPNLTPRNLLRYLQGREKIYKEEASLKLEEGKDA